MERINSLAASEGVFEDEEKIGEAAERIPYTYLQWFYWERYNELTHRFDTKGKNQTETGGNK